MTANSFVFPVTLAQIWVEGSVQLMRATGEFWSGMLGSTSARSTSTASPWWMPPQPASPPLWPTAAFGIWTPEWRQTMAVPMAPGASPFLPWLPAARTASAGNPFAFWQQMWLNSTASEARAPWAADNGSVAVDLWRPVAAAYRTANGHAMAAVLRTMADVVEPKPQGFAPAHYWPSTLGTRH
ncbi:MAG TPA: hypothetical protein VNZ50_08860 [Hyphomicrobiaceae bacterium]|nr:hypothetical protein [Hyphomicrobiaceae bacterium]